MTRVKVWLTAPLTGLIGTRELDMALDGAPKVKDLLLRLVADFPALERHLSPSIGEQELSLSVLIVINGREIAGLQHAIQEGDTVRILPSISGGQ